MVNIRELDKRRLFGDEEDVFLEHEEVTLDRLEVGFDTWVAITAVRCKSLDHHSRSEGMRTHLWKLPEPIIFFFERARKTPDTTSNVGSS